MRYRLRTLLVFLALVLSWAPIASAQAKPKTDFAFDPATIPPRPDSAQIVARCFTRYISLEELQAKPLPLSDEAIDQLRSTILHGLFNHVAEQEKLQARADEVAEFYRVLLNKQLDASEFDKDLSKNPNTMVGVAFVEGWKINRLLYKRYGGTVIFQQGNPREPVGAYQKLLEEAEAAQVFQIYIPDARNDFWNYFKRDHGPWVVSPEDISFDKPWWLQRPN